MSIEVGYGLIDGVMKVSFRTPYGIEWTLFFDFPNTPEGEMRAKRLAIRIQSHINEGGTDALNERYWSQRVIYGSQAYIDNEADIVAREREDDGVF